MKRCDHRCLQLHFLVGTTILNVICCYAPQSGLSHQEDTLYERVFSVVASVPEEEMLLLGGDLNGHVGEHSAGFQGAHGGSGYGMRNQDGLHILDFVLPTSFQLPELSFARKEAGLLLFHLEVIIHRFTSSFLGEQN